jgi:hypothetical protein
MSRKRDFRSHNERYGYEYTNIRQIVPYRPARAELEPEVPPVQSAPVPPNLPINREVRVRGRGLESREVELRAGPISLRCKQEVRVYDLQYCHSPALHFVLHRGSFYDRRRDR